MAGRPRKVENWDDKATLAKLRELVELGHDDNEIGRAFGYGEGRAFKLALRRQNAQAAIEILYANRLESVSKLLRAHWRHANDDDSKQQLSAARTLLERFERMAAGEEPAQLTAVQADEAPAVVDFRSALRRESDASQKH